MKKKKLLCLKIGLIILFLILTAVFTYPLIFNLTSAIPGTPDYTDGPFFLWNLWWVKESFLRLANPFYTHLIFFPQAVNLSMHTLTVSLGLLYLPLTLISKNLIIPGNLMVLTGILLNGWFSYLLVKYLTKSQWAGFIIACYLAFHPYIFSHLYAGHYNLIQIWTIPAILWLILQPVSPAGKGVNQWKHKAVLLGLLLVFQSYIDFHYTLFTGIVLTLWLALSPGLKQKYRDNLKVLGLAGLIWLGLMSPILSAISQSPADLEKADSRTIQTLSLKPFWSKNPFHPLGGKQSWDYLQSLPGQARENTLTLGWLVMGLAGMSLFFNYKKGWLWLFVLTGLIFGLITPGEKIGLMGKEITLPYVWIKNLLIFNQGLTLPRLGIMVIISLAVMAGSTLSRLFAKLNNRLRYLSFGLILALILFEIWSFPLAMDRPVQQPKQLLKALDLKSDWSFVYLPNSPRSSFYIALLNRPLIGGYIGRRVNNLYLPHYQSYPGVRVLADPSAEIFEGEYDKEKVDKNLAELNIRYIIVDKQILNKQQADNILPYLKHLALPLIYQDEQLDVYEVKL